MANQISSPQHEYLIHRQEYANEIGEAGERAIRSLIPLICSDLGRALWYHRPHHVNENGPDFDGVIKDTLKRVVIEISNLRPGSYINLNRAKQMERDAGPADYKIHIVSFGGCYTSEAREYLESHGWHIISIVYQVVTMKYLLLLDYEHPVVLYGCQDYLLIEPLSRGLEEILFPAPIYVSAARNHYTPRYVPLDADVDALDGAPLALPPDVDPPLTAYFAPLSYPTMPLPLHRRRNLIGLTS